MRVVSLVPSWTEMLIECGVNVVGRTRFCIHPPEKVQNIAVVGGTKDLQLEKLADLNADFLILDQEENLLWMKEKSPVKVFDTQVTSLASVAQEIRRMAVALESSKLLEIAQRWEAVAKRPLAWNWNQIPGEIELIRRDHSSYENLVYVIWKNPWMSVSKDTFIGSMLAHLGASKFLPEFEKKYPEFQMADFDLQKTYFLFSSEPFPFHRKKEDLQSLGVQGSVVNGESFSWFGLRSLEFLEKLHSSAAY